MDDIEMQGLKKFLIKHEYITQDDIDDYKQLKKLIPSIEHLTQTRSGVGDDMRTIRNEMAYSIMNELIKE
jgi:hypothetical protein